MDSSTYDLVSLALQLLIALVSLISAYQATRKLLPNPAKKEQKRELLENSSFMVQHHTTTSEQTRMLVEWMDLLLKHKGLEHSSSGPNASQ